MSSACCASTSSSLPCAQLWVQYYKCCWSSDSCDSSTGTGSSSCAWSQKWVCYFEKADQSLIPQFVAPSLNANCLCSNYLGSSVPCSGPNCTSSSSSTNSCNALPMRYWWKIPNVTWSLPTSSCGCAPEASVDSYSWVPACLAYSARPPIPTPNTESSRPLPVGGA
jgi:hypothetical protein